MKKCRALEILFRAVPAFFALAALTAVVPSAFALDLLFQDNFYVDTATLDANYYVTEPTRQSGFYAGTTYTGYIYPPGNSLFDGWTEYGYSLLGANTNPVDSTLCLSITGNYGGWPFPFLLANNNWNGAMAQGGMTISFDMNINGPYWGGIVLGADSDVVGGFPIEGNTTPRFGIQLGYNVENGLYLACDSSESVYVTGEIGANINNTWHHFDFVCTDPGDGNPFDGSGATKIDCYLDSSATPFYSYTKTDGGYANNYIGFQTLTNDPFYTAATPTDENHNEGDYFCNFDNLTIYGNAPNQWNLTYGDTWNDGSHWSLGVVPNAVGAYVHFGSYTTTPEPIYGGMITLDANVTVGTLEFNNANSYIIIPSSTETITFDGGSYNATIDIMTSESTHTISADMDLASDLDIRIASAAYFNMEGSLTAASAKNVSINQGGEQGTMVAIGGLAPGGAVTVNGGVLDMYPGSTLVATSVSGDGTLRLETNGILVGPPAIDIGVLEIVSGDYTVGTPVGGSGSESLGISIGVGQVTGSGYFTLNGGTLVSRSTGNIFPGGLSQCTIASGGGVIDTNGHNLAIYQVLQGDGALTITDSTTSPGVLYMCVDSPDWSGGMNVTNSDYTVVAYGDVPQALGTGPVNIASGSSLTFSASTNGMTVENDITLNGPGTYPLDPYGAALALLPGTTWMTDTNFTGTLTVHNDLTSGEAPDVCAWITLPMVFSGKITDGGGANPVGGIQIGNAEVVEYAGWLGNVYTFSGSDSNDYRGDTEVQGGMLHLAKTDGAIAIPSAHLYIGKSGLAHADVIFDGDDQVNPGVIVHMSSSDATGNWSSLTMMGHSQTIGGLRTDENNLNLLCNSFWDPADGTVGTLTVNSTSPDDYFRGIIRDGFGGVPSTGKFALTKAGSGTLTIASLTGYLAYTGLTTIEDGTLKFLASHTLSGDFVRGTTTSGTLAVSDTGGGGTTLVLNGLVDLGAATIDAGDSLIVTSAANIIDVVTGETGSTLQVTTGASLTSSSITVGTLTIGGAPPASAPSMAQTVGMAPVPEPSTVILLALAGLGALAAARRRK
ncbi:MAG: PEP-CTERM sorting domain-containing protein [Pirellulales bacterium]|nr:PEP-CTERM sorting domain-containing protein [Pirellulales bacterium]